MPTNAELPLPDGVRTTLDEIADLRASLAEAREAAHADPERSSAMPETLHRVDSHRDRVSHLLKPDELDELVDRIQELAAAVSDTYRTAYDLRYDSRRSGGWTQRRSTSPSDPTGDLGPALGRLTGSLRFSARRLRKIADMLGDIVDPEREDPHPSLQFLIEAVVPEHSGSEQRLPPTMDTTRNEQDRAEMAELKRMQAKRLRSRPTADAAFIRRLARMAGLTFEQAEEALGGLGVQTWRSVS